MQITVLNFNNILELVTMLLSVLLLQYTRIKAFKWLTAILVITVINEMLVVPYLRAYYPYQRNIAYNVFSFFDMWCWFAFFYTAYTGKKIRRILIGLAVVCFSYSIIELTIIKKTWLYIHSDSLRVYDIAIILLACYYLLSILKKEYHSLSSDGVFWVCTACMLYHAIIFINFTTLSETGEYWNNKEALRNFAILQTIANLAYYLFLCTAFLTGFYKHRMKLQQS